MNHDVTAVKKNVFVGLGETAVSIDPKDVIKTMALGSCVGIVLLDPKIRAVGMGHVVLPDSKTDAEKAEKLPGYFADTGVIELFDKMQKLGTKSPRDLIVKIMGGAEINQQADGEGFQFDIGKRNILAVKKALWKLRLAPVTEDLGGTISRTVSVAVKNGKVVITHKGQSWQL